MPLCIIEGLLSFDTLNYILAFPYFETLSEPSNTIYSNLLIVSMKSQCMPCEALCVCIKTIFLKDFQHGCSIWVHT